MKCNYIEHLWYGILCARLDAKHYLELSFYLHCLLHRWIKKDIEKSEITHHFHTFRKLGNPILWWQMLYVECFQMSVLSYIWTRFSLCLFPPSFSTSQIPFEIWMLPSGSHLYISEIGAHSKCFHFTLLSLNRISICYFFSTPPQHARAHSCMLNTEHRVGYGVDLQYI